jgi:hypothetical protein
MAPGILEELTQPDCGPPVKPWLIERAGGNRHPQNNAQHGEDKGRAGHGAFYELEKQPVSFLCSA